MLEVAQKHVGRAQLLDGIGRQQPSLRQAREGGQRRPQPQSGVVAAAHDLEHLGDELDLADAARPELDVVVQVAAPDLGADLRVQLAQAGDGAEVEVPAVDERRDERGELTALPGR